jgi:hypothetical protein
MNESEQQLKEEPAKQRAPRLAAEKAMPRSGADTLVKIIKGYAVASNGGETQINYKDVASAAGISPTVVSGNNSFLLESQILASPKYGFYVPSENAVRFAREAAWDETGAKAHLRKIVVACWYGQVVIQNFTLRSTLGREDLKRALAIKAGATEGDSSALDFLIDFLLYTALVVENENGTLAKGNFDEMPKSFGSAPTNELVQLPTESLARPSLKNGAHVSERAVSLTVHVHINSFDDLTDAHATRLKEWIRALQEDEQVGEVHLEAGDKNA